MKRAAFVNVIIWTALGLAGCDRENLALGNWYEAGERDSGPVSSLRGEARTTNLSAGTGRQVKAGDLVRVRVTVRVSGHLSHEFDPVVAWLWTGRESEPRDAQNLDAWGDLGSARVRRNLIGRRVGDQFDFQLADGAEGHDSIPIHAFAADNRYAMTDTDGLRIGMRKWPSAVVGELLPAKITSARFVILETCDARLLRRTAVLRQRGTIVNIFEIPYGSEREGTLRWSAIEASCPSSHEKLRFEVGPLYYYRGRADHALYNWADSYRRLRPEDSAASKATR